MRARIFWLFVLLLSGCAGTGNTYYQTSTLAGLLAGGYDGKTAIGDLPAKGDTGLGTFDGLDGEMVVVDGLVYQVRADGRVLQPGPNTLTPYAAVAFSRPDRVLDIDKPMSCKDLEESIDRAIPDRNLFYVLRADGVFDSVLTRSVPAQAKPYPPLTEVVKHQSVFDLGRVRGTLVGFRAPAFAGQIAAAGYHLHFLTEARGAGGHVLDCKLASGRVAITTLKKMVVDLDSDAGLAGREVSASEAAVHAVEKQSR